MPALASLSPTFRFPHTADVSVARSLAATFAPVGVPGNTRFWSLLSTGDLFKYRWIHT
jgi:hypothetical protein